MTKDAACHGERKAGQAPFVFSEKPTNNDRGKLGKLSTRLREHTRGQSVASLRSGQNRGKQPRKVEIGVGSADQLVERVKLPGRFHFAAESRCFRYGLGILTLIDSPVDRAQQFGDRGAADPV